MNPGQNMRDIHRHVRLSEENIHRMYPCQVRIYLSRLVGKPIMWFLNRSNTNRAAQAQKNARCLKFWIVEPGRGIVLSV